MSVTTLHTEAIAALTGPLPLPLMAKFEWWSTTPMEVVLTLKLDEELAAEHGVATSVTWHLARDLIDAAIVNPNSDYHGTGDVQVRVIDDCLDFYLMGNAGRAHSVIVDLAPVWKFMLRSYALVPPFAESVSVDEALTRIFGEESPC
jgi:hypothetical protein